MKLLAEIYCTYPGIATYISQAQEGTYWMFQVIKDQRKLRLGGKARLARSRIPISTK